MTIDRQSAEWAYTIGANHRRDYPMADAGQQAKLCPFAEPIRAEFWRKGFFGTPFLWVAK